MESAIYTGTVRHRRFRPAPHHFEYPLFLAYLDIDQIPELMRISPLCSYNRWNVASFDERDHFGNPAEPMRQRLQSDAKANGIDLPDGKVFLLTHLRYFGFNFNPVSFFYCLDAEGGLAAIVAEVNNTFGETRNYWLVNDGPRSASLTRSARKAFHVSPFLSLDCDYRFGFNQPGETIGIHMDVVERDKLAVDATLSLRRQDWNGANFHRALRQHPWMTARVVAAIHWQAFRLMLKRVPVIPHPGDGLYTKVNPKHWWSRGSRA